MTEPASPNDLEDRVQRPALRAVAVDDDQLF